ncbi:MAG: hypothetical protein AAGF56_05550 [Pseudomonadota bacterium]
MGRHTYFTACALISLVACGGGGNSGDTGGAVDTIQVASLSNMDRQTVFIGGAVQVQDVNTQAVIKTIGTPIQVDGLPDNYNSYSDGTGTAFALLGLSPNDTVQTVSTVGDDDLFRLLRLTPTTLPTASAGEVIYTGEYAAQYQSPQSDGTVDFGHMLGDAVLNVDFGDGFVGGRIENRRNSGSTPALARDIQLGSAQIEQTGTFSGFVSGGAFETQEESSFGRYQGVIGGSSGEDIAIGIVVAHGNPTVVEVGAAIVTGDP